MIPLPIYLDSYPTDLLVGYPVLRIETAEYIGYGSDPGLWTTQQEDELFRRVNEAYRHVLYPPALPGERTSHVWSCTIQYATLSTAASDYDYTLPTGFGSIYGSFTWPANNSYAPVKQTSVFTLMRMRQSGSSGRPTHFAVRWQAQTTGTNQRQEVLFYPTPDGTYTLTYGYVVNAEILSTRNPYPLGGPRMSQLVLEACRAVGETVKNGARGDQWSNFERSLAAAIQMDRGTLTEPTVGIMLPTVGLQTISGNPNVGEASYYFGFPQAFVLET